MQTNKRRAGDRRDGTLLRDIDAMHFIMPIIYPNRCDNEAFIAERIDLTNLNAYIEKKNAENPVYNYNVFQLIVTAFLKVLTLRPKMNRFIVNRNIYMRNEVSAAFVVKKEFDDDGGEALAFVHADPADTLETVHEKIYQQISSCRGDTLDSTSETMDMLKKLPRFVSKTAIRALCVLDRHGIVPPSMIETDPYYSSVVLTNLGSIKLKAGYHHLTNWGTNSVFVAVGEIKKTPFFSDDGAVTMKDTIDLGLIIDERLADGYYYSKTVRLLRTLLQNPELLEKRLDEKVDY